MGDAITAIYYFSTREGRHAEFGGKVRSSGLQSNGRH